MEAARETQEEKGIGGLVAESQELGRCMSVASSHLAQRLQAWLGGSGHGDLTVVRLFVFVCKHLIVRADRGSRYLL